jgi:hypothetical protein
MPLLPRHQGTVIAGTILQATKLPLSVWFLDFYLIGQATTGISSLELSRHLGVNYETAWQLHNKIMRAMSERKGALSQRSYGSQIEPTHVTTMSRPGVSP